MDGKELESIDDTPKEEREQRAGSRLVWDDDSASPVEEKTVGHFLQWTNNN